MRRPYMLMWYVVASAHSKPSRGSRLLGGREREMMFIYV